VSRFKKLEPTFFPDGKKPFGEKITTKHTKKNSHKELREK